jgi:Ser/Thr protein kinase RdoA (MazF antagonist)
MESIFKLYGWDVISFKQLHQGLINKTFTVETTKGQFILQTVNHHIFKDPWAIDHNINSIGSHLMKHAPEYLFTHLVPTLNGTTLIEWEGGYYRAFDKIESYALNTLENQQQAYEAASQFGKFTQILSNYDVSNLKITLPHFHDLSLRYNQFLDAIKQGNSQRINESKEAIAFLKANEQYVQIYVHFINHKEVKKRVTHHDTKISNVLFRRTDDQEKAIGVIDLDTVMPGYFISDIGDMCRTCLCSVSEEEEDLDKLKVDSQKWQAIKTGYLSQMSTSLSNFELDHLFFGGQFMIYMQALRFLTDHLNNDIYYGANKKGQNLVRALNQIRLLQLYDKLD